MIIHLGEGGVDDSFECMGNVEIMHSPLGEQANWAVDGLFHLSRMRIVNGGVRQIGIEVQPTNRDLTEPWRATPRPA